jgi:phosphate transport system substrate-binding protein
VGRGARRGLSVGWPVGSSEQGNEGMAARIRQTAGAIGYAEVVYVRQSRLPVVHLRNQAGMFVSPMAFEIASAAATPAIWSFSGTNVPRLLVDAPGEHSYPISAYTWVLVAPRRLRGQRTRDLAAFLRWALQDGSDIASTLGYVPLPSATADRVLAALDTIVADTVSPRRPR